MRHTRHGWWLEEAGANTLVPARPLEGDTHADVVIVGGGYLGMWTAWQLLELEPALDVVLLETELCGHGPSGRNGGFCETLWPDAAILQERVGAASALAVCRASEEAVQAIGAWCETNEVDAWFRTAPMLRVASSWPQLGTWDPVLRTAAELGVPEEVVGLDAQEVRARCDSPVFAGGALFRVNATVQPARLALGLRRKLLERGVRVHERTEVTRVHRSGHVATRTGRVRAGAAVLAVNAATSSFGGYRLEVAAASSHIVLTEPVPDVLEELGWTGGEAIVDSRTLVHYTRTTNDGRIVFGWGGGVMGRDGHVSRRMEVDPAATARAARGLTRFFPALRGRELTHAWGGPIDVSPTHLPIFRSRGRAHAGFGFTGNGVGPSYLGGEILARLALDRRDERTGLALVDPSRKLFPPEPARWLGGSLIRRALIAQDDAEDADGAPGAVTSFVASLPRLLGLRLPR
jgi:glycine/D-amino acid oxidase-like deaminating enzyme